MCRATRSAAALYSSTLCSCVKGMAGVAVLRALRTLHTRTLAATSGRCSAPVVPQASCVPYPAWRTSPVRSLQLCSALCAGHNKWSKVKHIKGPKDEARARMFMKFGMMIRIAVKGEVNCFFSIVFLHFEVLLWTVTKFQSGLTYRGGIQPRHEYKLSTYTGAVQKQEHAQSIHRGCHQECGRLTTHWQSQVGEK